MEESSLMTKAIAGEKLDGVVAETKVTELMTEKYSCIKDILTPLLSSPFYTSLGTCMMRIHGVYKKRGKAKRSRKKQN